MVAAPRRRSISLSSCHSLSASHRYIQLWSAINVLSHAVWRRQQTARSSSSACVLLAGVPPSFHSSLIAVLDCSLSNKARSQPAYRQLLSGPGGSGLHGGASATEAGQQMQKREKSFGKVLSLRFGFCEEHVSCVFSVFCVDKLQHLSASTSQMWPAAALTWSVFSLVPMIIFH